MPVAEKRRKKKKENYKKKIVSSLYLCRFMKRRYLLNLNKTLGRRKAIQIWHSKSKQTP